MKCMIYSNIHITYLVKNNIQYFITCGTLLGYVRHQGFIPWDNDIDICIFDTDIQKIRNLSKNTKYIIDYCYPGFRIKKIKNAKTSLDVFLLSTKDGNQFLYGWPYRKGIASYRTNAIFPKEKYQIEDILPIRKKPFLDFDVYVPNNPKKILYTFYGNNCLTNCKYYAMRNVLHKLDSVLNARKLINQINKIRPTKLVDNIYIYCVKKLLQ